MADVSKSAGGPIALCKSICQQQSSHGITQEELVGLISKHAKALHPQLTEAQACSKIFEANTEDGLALRGAIDVVKNAMFASNPAHGRQARRAGQI